MMHKLSKRWAAGWAIAALWAGGFGASTAAASGPLDPFPIQVLDTHGNCVAPPDHQIGHVTLQQYERISALGPADLEHVKDGTAPAGRTVAQWRGFRAGIAKAAGEDGIPDAQGDLIGSSTRGYASCRKTSTNITVLTKLGVPVTVTYDELVKTAPEFWRGTAAATKTEPRLHGIAETYLARAIYLKQHPVPAPAFRIFDEEALLTGDLAVRSDYDVNVFSQDVGQKIHHLVRSKDIESYVAELQRTAGAVDPGASELRRTVQAEFQELHGLVLDEPRGGKYAVGVAKRPKLASHPEEAALILRLMTGKELWTPQLIERFIVRSEFAGRIVKKDFGPFLAPHVFSTAAHFAKDWGRAVNVAVNPPGRFSGGKWTVVGSQKP
jgi:hypothetical protein